MSELTALRIDRGRREQKDWTTAGWDDATASRWK